MLNAATNKHHKVAHYSIAILRYWILCIYQKTCPALWYGYTWKKYNTNVPAARTLQERGFLIAMTFSFLYNQCFVVNFTSATQESPNWKMEYTNKLSILQWSSYSKYAKAIALRFATCRSPFSSLKIEDATYATSCISRLHFHLSKCGRRLEAKVEAHISICKFSLTKCVVAGDKYVQFLNHTAGEQALNSVI